MNCEMQEVKRQSVDVPKFYQNGFFHVWIIFVLGLLASFTIGTLLIIALVLLLGEIIFICQKKIYSKKGNEYKISKCWMTLLIICSIALIGIGFCRIGGLI